MAGHNQIKDNSAPFVIDADSRQVAVPVKHRVIGTEGDNNSEQITFECPRLINGHDVSQCARHYISWRNVNDEPGSDDLKVEEVTEDKVLWSWTIRDGLTVAKGLVSFSVHFEDGPTNAPTYRWSTTSCKSCEILEAVNAMLGTYKAIYVAGETLVISDFTPVVDGELALDMPGLIPEGTLEITENGTHDVGRYAAAHVSIDPPSGTKTITENGTHDVKAYASAKVAVPFDTPTITVGEDGNITAEANGKSATVKLSTEHDREFQPSYIIGGQTIFGVTGTATYFSNVYVWIKNETSSDYRIYYTQIDADVENYARRCVHKNIVIPAGSTAFGISVLPNTLCRLAPIYMPNSDISGHVVSVSGEGASIENLLESEGVLPRHLITVGNELVNVTIIETVG